MASVVGAGQRHARPVFPRRSPEHRPLSPARIDRGCGACAGCQRSPTCRRRVPPKPGPIQKIRGTGGTVPRITSRSSAANRRAPAPSSMPGLAGQAGTHRRADSWAWRAMPTCRSLLPQAMRRADSRADCTAVRTSPTSTARIVITTNSSTSEKPRGGRVRAVGMEQEPPRRARRPVEWAEAPLAGLSFTPAQIVPPETVLPTGGRGG